MPGQKYLRGVSYKESGRYETRAKEFTAYRKIILSILFMSTLTMIGCETTKGMGRDMEKAGQSIQNTAEKND